MTNWFLWLIIGLLILAGGVAAFFNPFAASLTVEQLIAWVFILGGTLQLFGSTREKSMAAYVWELLLSVAFVLLGIALLLNPLEGIVSLTLVLAVLLLASGAAKMWLGLSAWGKRVFWPIVMSGGVSVVLAGMILFAFPNSIEVVLGVLLSIELVVTGLVLILASMFVRYVSDEDYFD
ncbi:HdeD family acid-resistance protein [Rhodovulum sp. P5]|uniref:HdeD family acid-resistance protein n=1 Tax=Rhodovulum sp. P5 TaxID=1564506 RepID=UPI001560352A|nr:DUF308 domain-containing protein [Rhodovulum sp. P5]